MSAPSCSFEQMELHKNKDWKENMICVFFTPILSTLLTLLRFMWVTEPSFTAWTYKRRAWQGGCSIHELHKHLIRLLHQLSPQWIWPLFPSLFIFLCKMIFMWVHCAETYSLDQCSHSLTHSLTVQIQHSVCTHAHAQCEQIFCLSFILVKVAHTFFFFSSSLLPPPRRNKLTLLFFSLPSAVPFGRSSSGWYQQSFVRFFFLRSREESLEDTRITTEKKQREGVFFVVVVILGGDDVIKKNKIKKENICFDQQRCCQDSTWGILLHRCVKGLKTGRLADGCRFRGEESVPLRKGEWWTLELDGIYWLSSLFNRWFIDIDIIDLVISRLDHFSFILKVWPP